LEWLPFSGAFAVSLKEDTWNPERFNALELAWFQGSKATPSKGGLKLKPPPKSTLEDNTQTGSRYKYIYIYTLEVQRPLNNQTFGKDHYLCSDLQTTMPRDYF